MRRPRVYLPRPLTRGALVALDVTAARHVTQVLRLKAGAELILFDGTGGEWHAVLERSDRDAVLARIGTHQARAAESPLAVVLAQGVSRGERMDYTLQKAVELGVTRIVPLFTERSVVNLKEERLARRRQHWQAVAASACEQCGRDRVPAVGAPRTLTEWLADGDAAGLKLALDPDAAQGLPRGVAPPPDQVTLLIGAEGGLSRTEMDLARRAGFLPCRLGPRILRTETAAVAVLAALQTLWGDFS